MIGRPRIHAMRGGIRSSAGGLQLCPRRYSVDSGACYPDAEQVEASKPEESTKQSDFSLVVKGVGHFHATYGHFAIPVGFRALKQLPSSIDQTADRFVAPWPSELVGYPLGYRLRSLLSNPKFRLAHATIIDELRDLGLPIDTDWRAYLWKHSTLQPLETYKDIHGDVLVPRNFAVPFDDPCWPRETWGLRLGLKVMNIRQHRYELSPDEVADLVHVGFVWDVHGHIWKTRVLPALMTFKAVHGHCTITRDFIVPGEAPWPAAAWFMELGRIARSMRSPLATYGAQAERDRNILESIGFEWDPIDERWTRLVLPALETYSRLYGVRRRVETDFVVPSQAPWPKETWNFGLGSCIHNIRYGETFQRQVLRDADRLDAIGWLHSLTEEWAMLAQALVDEK